MKAIAYSPTQQLFAGSGVLPPSHEEQCGLNVDLILMPDDTLSCVFAIKTPQGHQRRVYLSIADTLKMLKALDAASVRWPSLLTMQDWHEIRRLAGNCQPLIKRAKELKAITSRTVEKNLLRAA